ncbi:putative zinc-binding metallopeptidase [Uliginosibacterium paludis]
MPPFQCPRCGQTVFFDNTLCGGCGAALGYLPRMRRMSEASVDGGLRRCANHALHGFCNWLLEEPEHSWLCLSCRLTRVSPDLSMAGKLEAWQKLEAAKKRVVVTLMQLGLTPEPKHSAEDPLGLSFEFLDSQPDASPVLTGHADGVITLNMAEADDVYREKARVDFGEPVRNLLGHFRHEVAHYLQYRWLAGNERAMDRCRAVFGDERADYASALAAYHQSGPPADWQTRFISAYASAHPWEDWAETCAHVLLVLDAVETAAAWGLRLEGPAATAEPARAGFRPEVEHLVVEQWLPVARFLNAMSRSMGERDPYPFLIPDEVLCKMNTVQKLLREAATQYLPGSA